MFQSLARRDEPSDDFVPSSILASPSSAGSAGVSGVPVSTTPPPSMSELFFPLDCWGEVLSYISHPSIVASCLAVSKPLHKFLTVTNPGVFSHATFHLDVDKSYAPIGFHELPPPGHKGKRKQWKRRKMGDVPKCVYPYVARLVVSGRMPFGGKTKRRVPLATFGSPTHFAAMFPRLSRLELRHGHCGLDDTHLQALSPSLRELVLLESPGIFSDAGLSALTGLRELRLDFSHSYWLPATKFQITSGCLSNMSSLEVLQACNAGESSGWTDAGFSKLTNLRKLVGVDLRITDGIFEALGQSLEVLVLDRCVNVNAAGFAHLTKLRRLWIRRGSFGLRWEDIRGVLPAYKGWAGDEDGEPEDLEVDFRKHRMIKGDMKKPPPPPFDDDDWKKRGK